MTDQPKKVQFLFLGQQRTTRELLRVDVVSSLVLKLSPTVDPLEPIFAPDDLPVEWKPWESGHGWREEPCTWEGYTGAKCTLPEGRTFQILTPEDDEYDA